MAETILNIKFSRKGLLFYAFLFCFSIFILASAISEPLKYLKYILPVIIIATMTAFGSRIIIQRESIKNNQAFIYLLGILIFYLIAFVSNLIKGFNNLRFYQEFYFVLSPLISVLFLFVLKPQGDYTKAIYLLFWAISISFFAEKFQYFFEEIKNPSILFDAFLTSELPTESNFAFQLGLFLIVFIEKRKWSYVAISTILFLLAFKRIAIVGVLVILILIIFRILSRNKINLAGSKLLILISNCLIVSVLFLFFSGTFDKIIEDTFGVSSNFITQGRYNIYQDIFSHFGSISLFGFGLGSINIFLSNTGYELVNLHSDVLKVFFELGPILFVAWIYCFHKWTNTFLSSCLAIYINILFLTDNVFIYFDVMFVFYVLMLYSLVNRKIKTTAKPIESNMEIAECKNQLNIQL